MRHTIVPLVAAALAIASAPAQMTRNVPAQYPTIQAAIAACANGDLVLVAPGTYAGAINFVGKAITVRGSGGAAVTTILGTPGANVVTFTTNEGSAAVLDGFTVTGGSGVFIQNCSPTIQNCRITNNARIGQGGGVYCLATGSATASPTFVNCTITNNIAFMANGGGIAFDGQSTVTSSPSMQSCTVSQNGISNGFNNLGGALSMSGSWSATFFGCAFDGNTAPTAGGACNLDDVTATFIACRFVGNTAGAIGGAIHGGGNVSLVSCLVADNWATQTGGGIYVGFNSPSNAFLIKNCTIAGNQALSSCGGVAMYGVPATATVTNSLLWGNSGMNLDAAFASVTYSDVGFGLYVPGVGTINADPRFADADEGDYHLSTISPCRNAGAPGTTGLPAIDMDGAARIVGSSVDMGADEVPTIFYAGTPDGLDLTARVDGFGDPLASTRPALGGQLLTTRLASANGALVGGVPLVAVRIYPTFLPFVPPPFAGVWLDAASVIVYGAVSAPPFGFPGLPADGLEFVFTVPPGLGALTVRIQGFVTSANAQNGLYGASNATEVTF